MRRNSALLMLVVLLLGILILREPHFAEVEKGFLRWLLRQSEAGDGPPVPLTVVDIAQDAFRAPETAGAGAPAGNGKGRGIAASPLEFALFLQAILDFEPSVVAFENILKWRERDKDQEQIFLDQAMRVPRLLLAAELGPTADPDEPAGEIRTFPNVSGNRGSLPAFSGLARQANEDLRLISSQGFVNLPDEVTSTIRVPLLFQYRGEVTPSFPLQAIMLWQRVTPAEVQIVLGSHILLPQNRRIPIGADGTLLLDPNAAKRARRMSLNELLLAAQEREIGGAEANVKNLNDHIVLARSPDNPLSPPDLFAATIATIQGGKYLRRISRFFDLAVLVCLAVAAGFIRKMARADLLLLGIAFTAAYGLIALGTISRWSLWLPGVLPLGAAWIAIIAAFIFPAKKEAITPSPPA